MGPLNIDELLSVYEKRKSEYIGSYFYKDRFEQRRGFFEPELTEYKYQVLSALVAIKTDCVIEGYPFDDSVLTAAYSIIVPDSNVNEYHGYLRGMRDAYAVELENFSSSFPYGR